MNIKTPPVYDVSHWKEIPDFKAITPRPFLVLTKATEGVSYVDPTFVRYMAGMREIGCHRGAYHFHRKMYDGRGQARHFLSVVNSYADDNTILILDVEEGGEDIGQLWAWFETVRANRPRNRLMIYSRKNILDPIQMSQGEADYFRRIPVWTAGYPGGVDDINEPPADYIPNQTRWGPVVLWQYTDSGRVTGISGDVDCNWISPTFAAILGGTQPGEEPMNQWFKVNTTQLNIRKGPGASYLDIGDLFSGEKIETSIYIGGWYQIVKIIRLNGAVEVPTQDSWCSGAYLLPIAAPEPPAVVYPASVTLNYADGTKKNYIPE